MKTLYILRHSETDAVERTLGRGGLGLAISSGEEAKRLLGGQVRFSKLFHSAFARTPQTALAFCHGLGYVPEHMPVVSTLGCADLFKEISSAVYRRIVASGRSRFTAVITAFTPDKVKDWALAARDGVTRMLDSLEPGETGIGFFHSPLIELAAMECGVLTKVLSESPLEELAGFYFCGEEGIIIPPVERVNFALSQVAV